MPETLSSFLRDLQARGHNVTYASDVAICQAVVVDPDTGYFTGVSDPRKDGAPAGYATPHSNYYLTNPKP